MVSTPEPEVVSDNLGAVVTMSTSGFKGFRVLV